MNVRQPEAFCKVMEMGSMSEAARALGISQPAVSKLIRLLEQALKLRLFKRSGDRLYPSMEAQRDVEMICALSFLHHLRGKV